MGVAKQPSFANCMVITYFDSISISEASTGSQRIWSDALEWTTILAIAVWSENQRIHSALLLLADFPMQLVTSTLYLRQPRFMPVKVSRSSSLMAQYCKCRAWWKKKLVKHFLPLGELTRLMSARIQERVYTPKTCHLLFRKCESVAGPLHALNIVAVMAEVHTVSIYYLCDPWNTCSMFKGHQNARIQF
jgi:hypothetical protein